MAPARKLAGCLRLGAIGAYNSRGGGVQGSRVERRGPGRPRRVRFHEPLPEPVVDAEPVAAGSPSPFPESEHESSGRSLFEPVQHAATPSDSESVPDEIAPLTPAQVERQATRDASVPECSDPPCEGCIRSATSGKGKFEHCITACGRGHRCSACARRSHKCVDCRRVLLPLVKALQFALDVEDPTQDQKNHTANLCRVLRAQMKVLDEEPSFFELGSFKPTVNDRIDFCLDAAGKSCLLVRQVDDTPPAPIDGTGVYSAAGANRFKRMFSDAVNGKVS